jgi:hypothetical protein
MPSGPCHPALCAALVAAGVLGACGGGGSGPVDASADTSIDSSPGTCSDVTFAGEVIDWDATNAAFCGVFKAALAVRGQPARTDDTNPNGRFGLCIPQTAETLVDVTYSADASQCSSQPGTYSGGAVLVAERAVIDAGAAFSARVMTVARQATMFTQLGHPYNAAQGQLIVHVVGPPHAVTLSTASHDPAQQFNGAAWEPVIGSAGPGSDVWFPNIDLAGGPVTATVAAGATGSVTVTLAPGAFTYVTVVSG